VGIKTADCTVIAGKAHPKDIPEGIDPDINRFIREQGCEKCCVCSHDIHVARLLVAGCDVWLTRPVAHRKLLAQAA